MSRTIMENIWERLDENTLHRSFLRSDAYAVYEKMMDCLDYGVLFESRVHGVGHIERTLLLGALIAAGEKLNAADAELLMEACAYHDTGRVSDGFDPAHGKRSAEKLKAITGRTGKEADIQRAMITLHSIPKKHREEVFAGYGIRDTERAGRLTDMLKDADGLDRVRINDLDPKFMRTQTARELVDFSWKLFRTYGGMEKEERYCKRTCRLLALDLDDTLVTRKKEVLPQTVRDIKEALNMGIEPVFCTGRGITEIGKVRGALENVRYAVLLSGALVTDLKEGKTLYQNGIGRELVREVLKATEDTDCMLHLHMADRSLVQKEQLPLLAEYHMGQFSEMFREACTTVEDIREEVLRFEMIPKINLYFRTPEEREETRRRMEHLCFSMAYAEDASLEISPPGVNKGTGLLALRRILGVPKEDTAAIGDAENDLEMFREAGFTVAMRNAIGTVKEQADALTGDQDHNGVGQAVRMYFKGKD